MNLLKSELEIAAFGKRMRIAHAIAELRRPPSVNSSDHQRAPSHSTSLPSSHQSLNSPLTNPYGNGRGSDSPWLSGDMPASPATMVTSVNTNDNTSYINGGTLDSETLAVGKVNGSGLMVPTTSVSKGTCSPPITLLIILFVQKGKPSQLSLSPSDGNIHAKAVGGSIVPEEDETAGDERSVLSDVSTRFLIS